VQSARLLFSLLSAIAVLGRPPSLPAQGTHADSSAILLLIQAHADAWNRHDARAAAAVYTLDADIRYSSGERLPGRPQIEAAHRAAFAEDTAGGGSRHSHPGPLWLRFVRPDLALVEVEARYDYPAGANGRAPAPERSLLFLVLTKDREQWSVLAQRNLGPVR
jgi:uncharacterized protein (TIGR02246 family)